jgi:hypothetical protein
MRRRALALAAAAALAAGAAGDPKSPGAYCPLPEGDAPPVCLEPAQQRYEGFFRGLGSGELDPAAAGEVERDLHGERRYEALSTLAYAYYTVSRRAAANPELDPLAAARLQRWNALLGEAWRGNESDPRFRGALREAAGDLERRAPAVTLRCTDPDGGVRECQSTAEMVAVMSDARDHVGLRGQIARLLDRLLGSEGR